MSLFRVRIQAEPLDLQAPAAMPQGQCGATVRFVGHVRNDARQAPLSHLLLEHFPGVTEAEIERIVAQARQRWDLQAATVLHRVGRIDAGAAIVLVETASAHRRDAYEANAFIMDYLKTEAPFWKQECFADASAHWVQAKASDQAAQRRWQATAAPAAAVSANDRAIDTATGSAMACTTSQTATTTATAARIGALILAGGQGQRMGGCNKGLQPLLGQPLVQHVAQALRPQVHSIAISANADLPAYQALGLPVWPDAPQWQGLGPLAGIASAAPQLPPDLDALLVVPCDTPLLPPQLAARLAQALFARPGLAAVSAATASGRHPSISLLRPALLLGLPQYLQAQQQGQGDLSLRRWLEPRGWQTVFFDDAQAFANLNDQQALQSLQQQLQSR
ncbi:molybdenum cofactor guanylyltransferase MobA [Vandammella animalimorsus]|nr:molybdenum cofactor guanylyltransferase MobA [Vandammella animalimorsus]